MLFRSPADDSSESDEDEEDNIEYEIVAKLPPKEEMEEDVLYFVVNDNSDIDAVKNAYEGAKDPSIINTIVCTPYTMHEGKVCKAFYNRESDEWVIDAMNPIDDKDEEKKDHEPPKDDTKEYSNPMIEMLKSKSNVKINLEDFEN